MRSVRIPVVASLVLLTSFLALPAGAKTPDGLPPSVETVCDGLPGAAFGICNAYCEAMDCDSGQPRASAQACSQKLRQFQRLTGSVPPCIADCPCKRQLPDYAEALNSGTFEQCIAAGTPPLTVNLIGPQPQNFQLFTLPGGPTDEPLCGWFAEEVSGESLVLTPSEQSACASELLQFAASQGLSCGN